MPRRWLPMTRSSVVSTLSPRPSTPSLGDPQPTVSRAPTAMQAAAKVAVFVLIGLPRFFGVRAFALVASRAWISPKPPKSARFRRTELHSTALGERVLQNRGRETDTALLGYERPPSSTPRREPPAIDR